MTEANRRTQTRPDLPDPNNDPRLLAYLRSVADWHGYMRFLGLPHLHENTDEPISRLFVEPHVHEAYHRPDEPFSAWAKGRHRLIDLFNEKSRCVLLLGDPGAGKSTLLNWVAWNFTHWKSEWLDRFGPLIPIPLVIRELEITRDITWNSLCDKFLQHGVAKGKLNREELDAIFDRGQAFVLVDGLDELSDLEARKALRKAITEGMIPRAIYKLGLTWTSNFWFLTSRIIGYDEVPYLVPNDSPVSPEDDIDVWRLSPIRRMYCCPLSDEQVEQFARTWFVMRETKGAEEGQKLASRFLRDLRAAVAPMALARIPNLLTLFALVYRVLAEIPHGRSVLYGKVAEAYLESIDKARGLKPKFTRDRMERWLAFVAFHFQRARTEATKRHDNAQEILIDRVNLLKLLVEEMPEIGGAPTRVEAEEFLDFAARRSGLLLPRGENRFAFMHLSFQEYFTARFLEEQITSLKWARGLPTYPGTSTDDLNQYADSASWTETMVLLFELLKPKPQWTEALRDALFGERYEMQDGAEQSHHRARLLAEILIDPHTGLEPHERRRDTPTLIDWELRRQKGNDWSKFGSVFPTILLSTGFKPEQRTADFWEQLQRKQQIRRLNLTGCVSLTDLTPLSKLTDLQNLQLDDCVGVKDLSPLITLTNLQRLTLHGCLGMTDLSPLTRLTNLRELSILGCVSVTDLAPLTTLTNLRNLNLNGCIGVTDLTPLSQLSNLQTLILAGCVGITDLSCLGGLTNVDFMTLTNLVGVTDFNSLSRLTNLQMLKLNGCVGVTDLTPLATLTKLQRLYLEGCVSVTDLTPLSTLTNLVILLLDGCVGVMDLAPLTSLTKLSYLQLRGTSVSRIPDELQRSGLQIYR